MLAWRVVQLNQSKALTLDSCGLSWSVSASMDGTSVRQVNLSAAFCVSVSLPSVEVGCGLGAVLLVLLLLFVIYHVFWLELLLIYRSWFGTKERDWGERRPLAYGARGLAGD